MFDDVCVLYPSILVWFVFEMFELLDWLLWPSTTILIYLDYYYILFLKPCIWLYFYDIWTLSISFNICLVWLNMMLIFTCFWLFMVMCVKLNYFLWYICLVVCTYIWYCAVCMFSNYSIILSILVYMVRLSIFLYYMVMNFRYENLMLLVF